MKKYRSHKLVMAAPVYSTDPSGASVTIADDDGHPNETVRVPAGFFARGVPAIGDYLVCYQPDGYLSWSPKDKFEDGYTEVADGTA